MEAKRKRFFSWIYASLFSNGRAYHGRYWYDLAELVKMLELENERRPKGCARRGAGGQPTPAGDCYRP